VSTPGSAGGATELFVNGTLMRGLGLHANLEGARFLGEHATEPIYRLFSIDDLHPGMVEVADGTSLRATTPTETNVQKGSEVWLTLPPERCRALSR